MEGPIPLEVQTVRPNIVLIMTDSQGPNVLGESGAGFVSTPHIDRLAREGLQFTRAYNCSPVCTPARAGLFTGLHPHSAGAWGNDIPLGAGVRTLGRHLQDAGYRTAYVGKWHLDGTDYFGTGLVPDGYEFTAPNLGGSLYRVRLDIQGKLDHTARFQLQGAVR